MSTLEISLIGVVSFVIAGVITFCIVLYARRPKLEFEGPSASLDVLQADSNLRASHLSMIEAFSQRLAAAEGRLTTIAVQQEGVAVLQQRLAAMEAHMPSLQGAMEQYADQIGRADKRQTERTRRSDKTAQSAGEAAAQLALVAGGEGAQPSATPPATSNNKRAGVLGGNRNR